MDLLRRHNRNLSRLNNPPIPAPPLSFQLRSRLSNLITTRITPTRADHAILIHLIPRHRDMIRFQPPQLHLNIVLRKPAGPPIPTSEAVDVCQARLLLAQVTGRRLAFVGV